MAPKTRAVPDLGDLDDAILLKCFSLLTPLPDLFNVAKSCRVSGSTSLMVHEQRAAGELCGTGPHQRGLQGGGAALPR